jgi:hypothetical protein
VYTVHQFKKFKAGSAAEQDFDTAFPEGKSSSYGVNFSFPFMF